MVFEAKGEERRGAGGRGDRGGWCIVVEVSQHRELKLGTPARTDRYFSKLPFGSAPVQPSEVVLCRSLLEARQTVTQETPPCSPTTMRSTTTCTKVSHGSVGVRHAVLRRERGRVGTIRISYGCPMYPHPPNRLKVGGVCLILEPAGTTPSHLAAQHCPPLATCFRC